MQFHKKGQAKNDNLKLDRNKKVPYGKHKGKTVDWLLSNDKSYCNWLDKEGLWKEWDLYEGKKANAKPKPQHSKPFVPNSKEVYTDPPPWEDGHTTTSKPVADKLNEFVTENDDVLIGLMEVPVPPVENKWIEEAKKLFESIYREKELTKELKERIEDILYMPIEN